MQPALSLQVPECTLDQGPGKMSIARIVAHESAEQMDI